MPNSRFALHGERPSPIHGLCAFLASNSRFMRLFQAALDTPRDNPFSATPVSPYPLNLGRADLRGGVSEAPCFIVFFEGRPLILRGAWSPPEFRGYGLTGTLSVHGLHFTVYALSNHGEVTGGGYRISSCPLGGALDPYILNQDISRAHTKGVMQPHAS